MNEGSSNKVLFDQLTGGRVEYPRMEEAFDVVSDWHSNICYKILLMIMVFIVVAMVMI